MWFRFAYPLVLFLGLPVLVGIGAYLIFIKTTSLYKFSLAGVVKSYGFVSGNYKRVVLKSFRLLAVLSLLFLAARPQWVDVKSNFNIDGIDIVIALDVSGSMSLSDDLRDSRTRISVAKHEAINFIQKRPNDEIGLVVFGTDALTLAPPTQDKVYLKNVIEEVEIGIVNHESTALGKGLATAIAKLRYAKAKSKMIILLTDGRSTAEHDLSVDKVIDMAVDMGVKVYTVGIGGAQPFFIDQFGRRVSVPDESGSIDTQLLMKLASKTGGKYFHVQNPLEIKAAYEAINNLEKTAKDTDLFTKYVDIFWWFFIFAVGCILVELVMSLFVWKIIG